MLPEAHSTMGTVLASEFDWKGAEREFRRALDLNPEVFYGWIDYIYFCLDPLRRLDEAMAGLLKAAEVDPVSVLGQFQIGRHYYLMGQYDRAAKQLHAVLELDPNYYLTHIYLALNYLETGDHDKSIREIETAAQITPNPVVQLYLGYVNALTGRIREAQQTLEELHQLAQKAYVPAGVFAGIYVGLGEIDKSLDWLEKAYDEGHALISHFVLPPFYERLCSHPRYHALLRKMNLADHRPTRNWITVHACVII
jgi:serine/threonine-protein kinase